MIIDDKKLKFIQLYKTIFYRKCKFQTNSEDKQIQIIVNALNIKNRKKRITYIYDTSCDFVDDFYNRENICGFKNSQCYIQQKKKNGLKNGCCRKCLFASNKGCTTKNLACKLFNCSEVKCRKNTIKFKDLKVLKVLSIRQRFIIKSDFFSLRESVLKDLYSYSFIYSVVRLGIRFIKNMIILNHGYKIKEQ